MPQPILTSTRLEFSSGAPLIQQQILGSFFNVTITARTPSNAVANTFNGPATLFGTNTAGGLVTISPSTPVTFTNGVWAGQVRVLQPSVGMVLVATNNFGSAGVSAPFRVLSTNDISVTIVDSPDPVPATTLLTYFIEVTNTGPAQATGILLTNVLSTNVTLVSVPAAQGSCTNDAGIIVCDLGDLAARTSAQVKIEVVPLIPGTITNRVVVSRAEADANPTNNTAVATTLATLPLFPLRTPRWSKVTPARTTWFSTFPFLRLPQIPCGSILAHPVPQPRAGLILALSRAVSPLPLGKPIKR